MECDFFTFYPCDNEPHLTFERSHQIWSGIFQFAASQREFAPAAFQLFLRDVPSYTTASLKGVKGEHGRLYAKGRAIWHIESVPKVCRMGNATSVEQFLLGISTPTYCSLDGRFSWVQSSSGGPDGAETNQPRGMYLAAFTCAWAFILSALWAEAHCGSISYTGATAPIVDNRDKHMKTGLRSIQCSTNEADWWASILANGSGWRATVKRDGNDYLSPWSIQLGSEDFTVLVPCTTERITASKPPSATEALSFLSRYCATYDLRQQGLAALFAALALPTHSLFARPAALPIPYHAAQERRDPLGDDIFAGIISEIPSLMTVSAAGIAAVLRHTLYDPETYCHVSGVWLNQVLAEWPAEIERAAIAGCARSPTVGGLWMGASVSSLVSRKFMQVLAGSGMWRANLPLSWWTGSPHSFFCRLSEQDARKVPPGPCLPRVEEAFLLFITSARGPERRLIPTPMSPWKPPGESILELSSLDVQRHANCEHYLRYVSWSWEGLEGMVEDRGFSRIRLCDSVHEKYVPDTTKHKSCPESLLADANDYFHSWVDPTRAIFQWLKEMRGPEADVDVNTAELLQVFEEDSDRAGSKDYEEDMNVDNLLP